MENDHINVGSLKPSHLSKMCKLLCSKGLQIARQLTSSILRAHIGFSQMVSALVCL